MSIYSAKASFTHDSSLIDSIREAQKLLDVCGEHNFVADVEFIPVQQVNEALRGSAQVGCEVPLLD
jgi:D-arabinose 1-dehydrogenase-like Zn-dependent alcohol dehydrogenase